MYPDWVNKKIDAKIFQTERERKLRKGGCLFLDLMARISANGIFRYILRDTVYNCIH